jgi:peptidoglycan/xylan/chitin deacetylase (PgdA/CDA1 family)
MGHTYLCFPAGKNKALSFSYDDGNAADRKLVDVFNRNGLKGTFHLNGGLLGQGNNIGADEVAGLYAGHEVAGHSLTHPALTRLSGEAVAAEILEDRKRLEDLAGYPVRGFSYPYGAWSRPLADRLASLGLAYARLVDATGDFRLEEDWMAWRTTGHHNRDLLAQTDKFCRLEARHGLHWFSVWGHSYEFDREDNWGLIEDACARLGGRTDVWSTTVIGMVDYVDAWRRLRLSAAGDVAENPSAVAVWLEADGKAVEVAPGARVRLRG